MKEKSCALLLLSWIHDLLLFEGIYILAAAFWDLRGHSVTVLLLSGLIMIFPVALSYIVICRCQNLWLFLVFSIVLTWGMRTVGQSVLTGGLTAFVLLFRCYVKLKQGEIRRKMKELPNEAGAKEDKEVWEVPTLLDSPRIAHCFIFVIMYLVLIYLHRYELLNLMLGILAAELCVCLAYRYLEKLHEFMKKNIRVANLPAGAMKKIGTGILLIGITGLLLFMLPAAIYHREPLSNLHLHLENKKAEPIEYYGENSEPDYMMEELMKLKAQAKETPKWLKAASEFVVVLTVLFIIYLALRLIFTAVRRAVESFSEDGDEIIFLGKEEGSAEETRGLVRRRGRDGFLSPNRRIRRFYKRLIRHALRESPCKTKTPFELEDQAGLYDKGEEEMGRIHALYEKARYGKEECTKDEVKQCMRGFGTKIQN